MKKLLLNIISAISMLLIVGTSYAQTVELELTISYPFEGNSFEFLSVYVTTNPEFISGPMNPIIVLPGSVVTTSLVLPYATEYDLTLSYACGEDSLFLPFQIEEVNTTNISLNVELSCGGGGPLDWDCPNLNSNIGDQCQGGWGVIDENCDCIEPDPSCLEEVNIGNLSLYFILECGNPANSDAWIYCGLSETLVEAMNGDEEACAEILDWIETNDWDGNWNGGEGDVDCPNLGANFWEYCNTETGTLGEVNEDCECIELVEGGCDLEVTTNLLANDDGTGNGAVEAIAEGGTEPYAYEWEAWSWDVIGTDAILNNCVAGTYFVQVTDANNCIAFGVAEVGTVNDTLEWDCPNLNGNIGDPCQAPNAIGWGIITEDCDCVEDFGNGGCEAVFTVEQAFYEEDGEAIPFALFVYLWDYNESNDYYWSFGDEGTSSDPFPVWTYDTNGPYELCLTVSNDLEECSNTYCTTIYVDSLGWGNGGFQDGFTITVINGDDSSINSIDEENTPLTFDVFPNPIIGNELYLNWTGESEEIVTGQLIALDGSVISLKNWFPNSGRVHMKMEIKDVAPGMYLLKMEQGIRSRTSKVIIR
jgi:hypothetical protein